MSISSAQGAIKKITRQVNFGKRELRPLLRKYQRAGYEAIFQAGSRTIRTLLANAKNLGSDRIGFFRALHTWGRDLKD